MSAVNIEQQPLIVEAPQRTLQDYLTALFALGKSLTGMILRIWIASLVICSFYILARKVRGTQEIPTFNNGYIPRDVSVRVSSLSMSRIIHGVPALFGDYLTSPYSAPLMIIKNDACSKMNISFPAIKDSEQDYKDQWIAMVPRGGCPFDEKVFYLQEAGFAGVIVYNNMSLTDSTADIPVRMSAHALGAFIKTFSLFVTQEDGLYLIKQDPKFITLEPDEWSILPGKETLVDFLPDVILLLSIVSVSGIFFLGVCLSASIIRNLIISQRFYFYEAIHEAIQLLTTPESSPPNPPKLRSIPFPAREITMEDLEPNDLSWSEGGTTKECAICLDEFVQGNQVRELPCRHVFHTDCVDPWLLQHNRLCPVCKRDVLADQPPESFLSQIQTSVYALIPS